MAGYWIVRAGEVTDADAQRSYGAAWAPIAERYGAKIIAGPGRIASKEGVPVARAFIVRFASYEQALACYEDPAYQAAAEFGKKASQRDVVILEGP
jgi:uncharacterized protein (DUF1330 family)